MRKYYGEVADENNWERKHRKITVEAEDSQEAFKKISELKEKDEGIYQISRDFDDCSCPQPVYDFFNSFSLASLIGRVAMPVFDEKVHVVPDCVHVVIVVSNPKKDSITGLDVVEIANMHSRRTF